MQQIKVFFKEELRMQLLEDSNLLTKISARAGESFFKCRGWLKRDSSQLTNYGFILSVSEEMNLPLDEIVDVFHEN